MISVVKATLEQTELVAISLIIVYLELMIAMLEHIVFTQDQHCTDVRLVNVLRPSEKSVCVCVFILNLYQNLCCGYSKDLSHLDDFWTHKTHVYTEG